MSIPPPNSPLEKQLVPPKNPHLKNQNKKINLPFAREIFPSAEDEAGKEKYQDPTVVGHIILIGIQLGLVIIAYIGLTIAANIKANSWMKEFEKFNLNKTNQIVSARANIKQQKTDKNTPAEISSSIIINQPEKDRIIQQFREIQARSVMHYNIMIDFYQTRYIAISMALGLASISILCLIFISRSGWEKVHKGIINIFMITTAFAIFYSDIVNVYQHEENIAINEVQYESYVNLGNYIISYLITKIGIDGKEIAPKDFIHKIDFIMEEINDIFLTFDNTSIDRRLKRISSVIPEANEPPAESENNQQRSDSENED